MLGGMSELVRVTRGVWRSGDAVDTLAGRAAALLAATPDGSVTGGLAAAHLHALWLPDECEPDVELLLRRYASVPKAHAGTRRREIRGRRRILAPDEVTYLDGLPITTPARTWVDLGEHLGMADLVAAGDSVLRGGTSADELAVVASRAVHRRGIVRVRAALPLLDARSRSRPESHLRYALVSSGLPAPQVNEPIYDENGQWLGEPDLSYDDVRLAIEYNGADHGEVRRMRRDITREVDIGFRGHWRTITFGPVEVFRRPDQTAAYVRDVRRERRRLLS
jgi:hypothetical protein